MNTSNKVLLFLLIIVVASISVLFFNLNHKEKFTIDLVESPNLDSCWQNIAKVFKWNIDGYNSGQKKVLLTMKALNASYYSDKNNLNPEWTDKCVIPKEHLPIYNKNKESTADWDLYNASPNPNSQGYMRYTTPNGEGPDGYVVDLTKHNSQSFQNFLNKAYELYDEEFFKQKADLEAQIKHWEGQKKDKQNTLASLQSQVNSTNYQYNQLLEPSNQCQINKGINIQLIKDCDSKQKQINKTDLDIQNHNHSINVNKEQIKKMQSDYNKYSKDETNITDGQLETI